MRKAYVILCSLFIICSCNSNEEKPKPLPIQKVKPVQSASDIAFQTWLKGKVWTAENDLAPMALLKLRSDSLYELKSGNPNPWEIINGTLSLEGLVDWPIEKVDDSTFRLYVKPTDKWYSYKHTGTLD